MQTHQAPIVFYDGLCGLCDRSVQFLLKYDKKEKFLFCALQSEQAKHYLGVNYTQQSIVLYQQGKVYYRSTAALRIAWLLGGFWSLLAIGLMIPAFIRNAVYDFVAKNRYKWFGKFDACKIPTPEMRKRFIDV